MSVSYELTWILDSKREDNMGMLSAGNSSRGELWSC